MDQLTSMQVSPAVLGRGSFAQAGLALGVSAPKVSKQVAPLGKRLDVRLLHRSSRHVSLTKASQRWYTPSSQALQMCGAAHAHIGAG